MRRSTRTSLALLAGIAVLGAAEARQDATSYLAQRELLDRTLAAEAQMSVRWSQGHATFRVWGLSFSPDGERLLSVAQDGSAWLWDAYTGEALARLGPFAKPLPFNRRRLHCRFRPDGERLLAHDESVARASLWDGRTGDRVAGLSVGDERVDDVAFGPEGEWIVTAAPGALRVFDGWTGELVREIAAIAQIAQIASQARGFRSIDAHPHRPWVVTCSDEQGLELWDVERAERIASKSDPKARFESACFSDDGGQVLALGSDKRLFVLAARDLEPHAVLTQHTEPLTPGLLQVGGKRAWTVGQRLQLVLHDLESGAQVELRKTGAGLLGETPLGATFSPDGTRLVGVGADGRFRIWDASDGRELFALEGTTRATTARFTTDGRRLIIGERDYEVLVFDAENAERLATLHGPTDQLDAIAVSSVDDRVAVGTHRGYAVVWNIERPDEPLFLRGRSRPHWAWGTGLAPDGSRVVSSPFPRGDAFPERPEAAIWDTSTGRVTERLPVPSELSVLSAMFGPQGRQVACSVQTQAGDPAVRLIPLDEPERARTLQLPEDPAGRPDMVTAISFSADGRRLVASTWWRGAVLFDTESGAEIERFPEAAQAQLGGAVLAPDGRSLATAGKRAGSLFFWSEDGGRRRLEGHTETVRRVVFAPDGSRFATPSVDGTTRLWDATSGEPIGSLESGAENVLWADFDGLGERLVTAGSDGVARVWDVESGSRLAELSGHPGAVTTVTFGPDGQRILTLAADGIARLFTADGELVVPLEWHAVPILNAAFSADSRLLFTIDSDDAVRLWDGRSGELLATRVTFENGEWLTLEPNGHYVASPSAADWTDVRVGDRWWPLSSYARVLAKPEHVQASLAGATAPKPLLYSAPELEVVAPHRSRVSERRVTLDLIVRDRFGIESVTLVQDGEPIPEQRVSQHLERRPGGREGRLTIELEIESPHFETTIEARATNVRGIHSAREVVYVHYEPPARDLYVVAMGVADYDDDELDLAYPIADVDGLIARFRAEEGGLYRAVHVQRIVDHEVTPGRLKLVREEFLRRAQPEDTIIVFAAGHGVRSQSGEYYFLTPSADPARPYDGIDRALLESLVVWERLFASRRVLFLDTCHAGENAFGAQSAVPLRGRSVDTPSFAQQELDDAVGQGLYILAATPEVGFAREMAGNGLFTRVLLDGLDGAADDAGDANGWVEIDELIDYAGRMVAARSEGRQRISVPRVEGGQAFPLTRALARDH